MANKKNFTGIFSRSYHGGALADIKGRNLLKGEEYELILLPKFARIKEVYLTTLVKSSSTAEVSVLINNVEVIPATPLPTEGKVAVGDISSYTDKLTSKDEIVTIKVAGSDINDGNIMVCVAYDDLQTQTTLFLNFKR